MNDKILDISLVVLVLLIAILLGYKAYKNYFA